MTKLEQAARQALEALYSCEPADYSTSHVINPSFDEKAVEEAITALREALAEQPVQDLDTCPGCGGVADNGHDREFPPNPYYCTKCTEQAEQEPVYAFRRKGQKSFCTCDKERYGELGNKPNLFEVATFYAAPVRTKDLTDDEIQEAMMSISPTGMRYFIRIARAVIAADREKNK